MSQSLIQQEKEVENKGRPGLTPETLAKLLFYKFKNLSNVKVAKKMQLALTTVNKYWAMYQADEIAPEIIEQAKGLYEVESNLSLVGQSLGVNESLITPIDPSESALVRIDEVINMAVLSKIVNAAIKEASGEFVKEKIDGMGIKKNTGTNGVGTKFGYMIDDERKVILSLERLPPNPRNLMTIVEFLKKQGIDTFEHIRTELGIEDDTGIDLSDMTPEEASSEYMQLVNGDQK